MLSILLPTYHSPANARALNVCVRCIAENTVNDYELLIDCHRGYSVYESFNRLSARACGGYVALLNDDMFVAPRWDEELLKFATPYTVVIGSQVESGLTPVGEGRIAHDFGTSPEEFRRSEFEEFTKTAIRPDKPSWLWPWLIDVSSFEWMGGFQHTEADEHGPAYYSDFRFIERWSASGRQVVYAPSWSYHLMRWTVRNGGELCYQL